MKSVIEKQGSHWQLRYYAPSPISAGLIAYTETFMFYEGAWARFDKLNLKIKREQKALSRLKQISLRFLSVREHHFIQKLNRTKCKDITQRQAGYLKGIWERQG